MTKIEADQIHENQIRRFYFPLKTLFISTITPLTSASLFKSFDLCKITNAVSVYLLVHILCFMFRIRDQQADELAKQREMLERDEAKRLKDTVSRHRNKIIREILDVCCPHCDGVFVDWLLIFSLILLFNILDNFVTK